MTRKQLVKLVDQTVHELEPGADIILYGSRARGDARPDSDWDFLILLNGEVDFKRTDRIRDHLYDVELEYDQIISSIVRNRGEWYSKYQVTPLYKNVSREGVTI